MNWYLPTTLTVDETEYEIITDFRAVLDICTALNDPELSEEEKWRTALDILYPAYEGYENEDGEWIEMPTVHYQEAVKQCFWFIGCGKEETKKQTHRLVDWEQDYQYIVSPINRVLGKEVRSAEYIHWWTFIAAYYEIGDCYFAQIIRIRQKRAQGKPLDKTDRDFYRKNRDVVDIKTNYTKAEDDILKMWTGGGNNG